MISGHAQLLRHFLCYQVQSFISLKCISIQWLENKNIWGLSKLEEQWNCIFKGIICSTFLLVIIFCSGLQRFCFWHLISFTAASNWIRITAEQQEKSVIEVMLTDNFVLFSFLFSLYFIYIWNSTPRREQKQTQRSYLSSLVLLCPAFVFNRACIQPLVSGGNSQPPVFTTHCVWQHVKNLPFLQHTAVLVHVSHYHPERLKGVKDDQIFPL